MQYDTIILELMSRIQALENEVDGIKALLGNSAASAISPAEEGSANQEDDSIMRSGSYSKMTEEMIRQCYILGESAYGSPNADLAALADKASALTGMNRNSAFIYIYVVKCLLSGEVYKRAISTTATKEYLNSIYEGYGKAGLSKAVYALGKHISYRKSIGHTVDGLESLYKHYHTEN